MSSMEDRIEEILERKTSLSFTDAFSIFAALAKKHDVKLTITQGPSGRADYTFEPVVRECPYAKMSCGEGDDGK